MRRITRGAIRFLTLSLTAMAVAAVAGEAAAASLVWTKTYNPAVNDIDIGMGVAVAADGSIYVTGLTEHATQARNLLLSRYAPSGARLWTRMFNGAVNGDDAGNAVAIGPDGSVHVAGYTTGAGTTRDVLLRKHAPGGRLRWQRTYNGPGNTFDRAYAVAVGGNGSVYVAGETSGGVTGADLLLVKYSPSGARAWVRTYNTPGNGNEGARGVAVAGNSVYVVGYAQPFGQSGDLLLRKYTAAGALVWSRILNKATTSWDAGYAVAVDRNGDVYVAGATRTVSQSDNVMVRKYSPAGATRWTRFYDNPQHGADEGTGAAIAADGSLVVTGYSYADKDARLLLLRYSPSGALLQARLSSGGPGSEAAGQAVATGAGTTFYVTGFAAVKGQTGSEKLLLQKYQ